MPPCCLPTCRLVPCSHVNSVAESSCEACGAARWDGDDGQLSARVRAILQASLNLCAIFTEKVAAAFWAHLLPWGFAP